MKVVKSVSTLALIAAGLCIGATMADAHDRDHGLGHGYGHHFDNDHGHWHGHGVRTLVVNPILIGPSFYDSGFYPPVVSMPSPSTYIEQGGVVGTPASPPPAAGYWYYCDNPSGYYPDVKECPGGWRAVAPRPPG